MLIRLLKQYEVTESRTSSPNTSFAIFRTAEAAQKLCNESPIKFQMELAKRKATQPLKDTFDMLEAADPDVIAARAASKEHAVENEETLRGVEEQDTEVSVPIREDEDSVNNWATDGIMEDLEVPKVPKEKVVSRTFLVHASPWKGNMEHHIERSHYSGPFEIERNSIAQRELQPVVPLIGLSMVDLRHRPVLMERVQARRRALQARVRLADIVPGPDEENIGMQGLEEFIHQRPDPDQDDGNGERSWDESSHYPRGFNVYEPTKRRQIRLRSSTDRGFNADVYSMWSQTKSQKETPNDKPRAQRSNNESKSDSWTGANTWGDSSIWGR